MGRNLTIDVLKIVLAFFVVFLQIHFLKNSYPEVSYLLVNGLFRIAVPVFLLITGFYFFYIDTSKKLKNGYSEHYQKVRYLCNSCFIIM